MASTSRRKWTRDQEQKFCHEINELVKKTKANRVSGSELVYFADKVVATLDLPKKLLTAGIVRKSFEKNLIDCPQTLNSKTDRTKLWNTILA